MPYLNFIDSYWQKKLKTKINTKTKVLNFRPKNRIRN